MLYPQTPRRRIGIDPSDFGRGTRDTLGTADPTDIGGVIARELDRPPRDAAGQATRAGELPYPDRRLPEDPVGPEADGVTEDGALVTADRPRAEIDLAAALGAAPTLDEGARRRAQWAGLAASALGLGATLAGGDVSPVSAALMGVAGGTASAVGQMDDAHAARSSAYAEARRNILEQNAEYQDRAHERADENLRFSQGQEGLDRRAAAGDRTTLAAAGLRLEGERAERAHEAYETAAEAALGAGNIEGYVTLAQGIGIPEEAARSLATDTARRLDAAETREQTALVYERMRAEASVLSARAADRNSRKPSASSGTASRAEGRRAESAREWLYQQRRATDRAERAGDITPEEADRRRTEDEAEAARRGDTTAVSSNPRVGDFTDAGRRILADGGEDAVLEWLIGRVRAGELTEPQADAIAARLTN